VTLEKLLGKLGARGRQHYRLGLAARIVNPTSLVKRIEKIPIHPLPRPRGTMISKHSEAENRQRGFAQLVVIQIGWKRHDQRLTPHAPQRMISIHRNQRNTF
jgi:hypothetical protein